MFALLITDSTGETHIHPISPEEGRSYTLGRSEECDIALPTEIHLSRTHCILTIYGQRVYLQDNNSSNGIFVGSRRITEEYMDTEREYQIANCRMVLIRTQAAHTMPEAEEDLEREAEDTPPLQEELAPAQELLPCPAPVPPPAEEEQQAALPHPPSRNTRRKRFLRSQRYRRCRPQLRLPLAACEPPRQSPASSGASTSPQQSPHLLPPANPSARH